MQRQTKLKREKRREIYLSRPKSISYRTLWKIKASVSCNTAGRGGQASLLPKARENSHTHIFVKSLPSVMNWLWSPDPQAIEVPVHTERGCSYRSRPVTAMWEYIAVQRGHLCPAAQSCLSSSRVRTLEGRWEGKTGLRLWSFQRLILQSSVSTAVG